MRNRVSARAVSRKSPYLGRLIISARSREYLSHVWRHRDVVISLAAPAVEPMHDGKWAVRAERGPYIRYGKLAALPPVYRQQSRFPSWSCAIAWVPSPLIRCNDINQLYRCQCRRKLEMFSFSAWPSAQWYQGVDGTHKILDYVFETLSDQKTKSEVGGTAFSVADFGVFSMFGRTGAPTRGEAIFLQHSNMPKQWATPVWTRE